MKKPLKSKPPRNAEFAFNRTLRFLTVRPRSQWEVLQYLLIRLKVDDASAQSVLSRVQHLNFVNDAAFAAWWIDKALRQKQRSLAVLYQELKAKHLAEEIIDSAIKQVIGSESRSTFDLSNAIGLLERRRRLWTNLESEERVKKTYGFLARRGFSFDVARAAVKRFDNIGYDFVQ
ncbi:MAG: regulatory protein RecX [bacterium]|nr:regulatory protein RecX [bacterium]